ncbi:unnamed protein product [Cylindrotheca closterium]|uniref:GAG-pre-integrase domain-containing protein n=1 Tax=Cylindrotheca closterium TaxID=2856 RepID=A0AAD2JNS1_9STRA|nr:unnamed protein product [Cylindrotheca closterium]
MTHLSCNEARLQPTPTLFRESLIDPATIPVAGPPVTDSTECDKQLPLPTLIDSDLHFDLEEATAADHITNLSDLTETDKHTIMLRWHYRLGHTPFPQLKQMAKYDLLDKRLATIQEFPFCPGCQFGKQTRRAWRHRSNKKLRR